MKKQVEQWLTMAKEDLSVVEKIQSESDLTNMIVFHSQQAIEKSLKAILEEKEGIVPRIHNLITLRKRVLNQNINITVNKDAFDQLNELYLDSRYPSGIGLPDRNKPDLSTAKLLYKEAVAIFNQSWKILGKST